MQYVHMLPDDIQQTIYNLAMFKKHQEHFKKIHEELKQNEFENIIHLRCNKHSTREIKQIVFPELGDNIEDLKYVTKLMFYLETTSTMIRKNGMKYNIIGYLDQPVHCEKCNMATNALVNHKKRKLECKQCKLNKK